MTVYVKQNSLIVNTYFLLVLRFVFQEHGDFVTAPYGTDNITRASSDGINWTDKATLRSRNFWDINYSNGTFVITGENGKIFSSTNLTTWTQRTSNVTVNIGSVTYGNNQFVEVGQQGII